MIAQMRRPSLELGVHCQLGDNDGFRDVFARFGEGEILCAKGSGHAAVYDVDAHSFVGMPAMNSHKNWYIAVHGRRTAEHGWSDPEVEAGALVDDKHSDSVYVLDYLNNKPCCFEVLACHGASAGWRWRQLPPPPFFGSPEHKPLDSGLRQHAVVDGTKICVCSATATYAFDAVAREWSKAGDWVLPFHGKAEYVSELGLWLGSSSRSPNSLCAQDLSAIGAAGSPPPPAHHVGLHLVDPPENWWLSNQSVVNLGMGRFCVARMFFILKREHSYDNPAVVFTGVEVLPSTVDEDGYQAGERQFCVIKHKTEYFSEEFIRHLF